MKNLISLIRKNFRLYLIDYPISSIFVDNRMVTIPLVCYSFNSPGIATKYIPTDAEIIGISGGKQISDRDMGEKEILNTFWKGQKEEENKEKGEMSAKARSTWVWVAATFIILIFAFNIIQNRIRNAELDRLFQSYYSIEDFSIPASVKSYLKNDHLGSLIQVAFNQRNYTLVRDRFRFVSVESPLYNYYKFINGICLIQDRQYQSAIECLNSLKGVADISSQVSWYNGLCYVKLGNVHSAILLFQKVKEDVVFEKKASAILQKLKIVN